MLTFEKNAAREYMIDLLRDMEVPVDDREKEIEILSARIEFLNAQKEFAKDLEIQLNEDRATIEQYKKEIEKSLEEQKLLRFRKWQSSRHLSELLNQVYGLTNIFLFALDKSGKLNDGTMVTRGFTTALREAADCSRPLAAEWARLEKLRRECHDTRGLPATADLPGGESNEDGSRENLWVKLHHAEMAYAKLRAHQDERERHFLGTIAHPFLIDIGRIRNHRRASLASSVEDLVSYNPQPSAEAPPIPPLGERKPELEEFLHGRRELKKWRSRLDSHHSRYSSRLATFLYAWPQSGKENLENDLREELKGKTIQDKEKQLRNNIRLLEDFYRKVGGGTGVEDTPDLLFTAEWAGSVFDVAPSQASSLRPHVEKFKSQTKSRDIRQWYRSVTRLQPDGPDGSPGGRRRIQPEPYPPTLDALPSPRESEVWDGAPSSTLTRERMRLRIQSLNNEREQLRQHFTKDFQMTYDQGIGWGFHDIL